MCLICFVCCVSCSNQSSLCMCLMCWSVNRGDLAFKSESVCRAESGCGSVILLDLFQSFLQHALFCSLLTSHLFSSHWIELNQCMCIPEYIYVRINVRWFLKNNQTEWHLQYLLLFLTCLRKHDICENGVRLQCELWRAVDGLWLKHHDQHGL